MNTDFDSQLTRLFAEQNQSLPAEDFLRQTLQRLERQYRWQRIRMAASVIAIVAVGAIIGPKVESTVSTLLAAATDAMASTVSLSSFAGMVTAGIVLAVLPVAFVWRTLRG